MARKKARKGARAKHKAIAIRTVLKTVNTCHASNPYTAGHKEGAKVILGCVAVKLKLRGVSRPGKAYKARKKRKKSKK